MRRHLRQSCSSVINVLVYTATIQFLCLEKPHGLCQAVLQNLSLPLSATTAHFYTENFTSFTSSDSNASTTSDKILAGTHAVLVDVIQTENFMNVTTEILYTNDLSEFRTAINDQYVESTASTNDLGKTFSSLASAKYSVTTDSSSVVSVMADVNSTDYSRHTSSATSTNSSYLRENQTVASSPMPVSSIPDIRTVTLTETITSRSALSSALLITAAITSSVVSSSVHVSKDLNENSYTTEDTRVTTVALVAMSVSSISHQVVTSEGNTSDVVAKDESGHHNVAMAVGLSVIFGVAGVAVSIVIIIYIRHHQGKYCQRIYRRRNDVNGLTVTYSCIENGNYIGPVEKPTCTYTTMNAAVGRSLRRPGSGGLPDEIMLLPCHACDTSVTDGTNVPCSVTEEQSSVLRPDILDELDQPVLIDIESLLGFHRTNAATSGQNELRTSNPVSFGADAAAVATGLDHLYLQPSCHVHHDSSRPGWRPFHEYDPIYVPRHDAASMARRVDESSYVRTPRFRMQQQQQLLARTQPRSEGVSIDQHQSDSSNQHLSAAPAAAAAIAADNSMPPIAPPRIASAGRGTVVSRERRRPLPSPVVPNVELVELRATATGSNSQDSDLRLYNSVERAASMLTRSSTDGSEHAYEPVEVRGSSDFK